MCADIIMSGHRAFFASAGLPYDIVAEIRGRLFRIAIKSTSRARPLGSSKGQAKTWYQFNIFRRSSKARYTEKEADIIALVGLDRRFVAYLPCVNSPSVVRFNTPKSADFTLESAVSGVP